MHSLQSGSDGWIEIGGLDQLTYSSWLRVHCAGWQVTWLGVAITEAPPPHHHIVHSIVVPCPIGGVWDVITRENVEAVESYSQVSEGQSVNDGRVIKVRYAQGGGQGLVDELERQKIYVAAGLDRNAGDNREHMYTLGASSSLQCFREGEGVCPKTLGEHTSL